ncbi:MAG: NADH-quinone oxidoreductase subunit M [Desulfuromonadaceae bacterium]|nr:NADH-quinone oxidoreductase subunit M [Desulfuromonadaceae bacterium]
MDNYLILNTFDYPILSLLLILPVAGAVGCLFLRNERALKFWGLAVTLATAIFSCQLFSNFNPATSKYQFAELHNWFPALNLDYVVGVDGISVLLVLLTTFIMPLCILCSWRHIDGRLREFLIVLLLMETAMIGVFVSLNTVLFYIFWEGMLIPMYLLIAVWGGPRRDYASIKFFLYTFTGSIFLLVAIIALYVTTGTFFIPALMEPNYPFPFQMWIFLACALSFAVKLPVYPLHTWLPAAHVEAPAAGSVILASILLKMGGYGFLRLCLPIAPAATLACMPYLIGIALVSIVIGGYLALGQSDIKKLIAYSSVGHMGFVTLGIFLLSEQGLKGALLQMINHGITTGALFICVGIIYERTHSREIDHNAALAMKMPRYVTFLGLFCLASFGFPGTNGFVSEFLVLIATFAKYPLAGAAAILGAVLAAAYMLRLLQKMIWGRSDGHGLPEQDRDGQRTLWDLDLREMVTLGCLAALVLWLGLYPRPLLTVMDRSIVHLLEQVEARTAVIEASAVKFVEAPRTVNPGL